MSLPTKIFGYEPAAIGATLAGIVPLLVFIHWWHLTGPQLGLISTGVAAVTAAYVALSTQHATLAVVLGVVQAGIALGAGFGAGISNEQSAAIIGATGVIFGFFNRSQTTPLAKIRTAAAAGAAVYTGQVAATDLEPTYPLGSMYVDQPGPTVTYPTTYAGTRLPDTEHSVTAAGEPISVPAETIIPTVNVGHH